ncbi:MAG UNVERIFIED_CONTAM: hypothetical protein LVR18_13950 [Planctomycetaceae bacterium]|jgi:hypothetical protein
MSKNVLRRVAVIRTISTRPAESVDSLNPVNHRPLEWPVFSSLLMPHSKLLPREWAQAELDLTPSFHRRRAIQLGLEPAKRIFPTESIGLIDLYQSSLSAPLAGTVPAVAAALVSVAAGTSVRTAGT